MRAIDAEGKGFIIGIGLELLRGCDLLGGVFNVGSGSIRAEVDT